MGTRPDHADTRLGQSKLSGPLNYLKLPRLEDGKESGNGHGISLVRAGSTVALSVCCCPECDLEECRDWRDSYEGCLAGASMPTLVLLSLSDTVVSSMRTLDDYLQGCGLKDEDSRRPNS